MMAMVMMFMMMLITIGIGDVIISINFMAGEHSQPAWGGLQTRPGLCQTCTNLMASGATTHHHHHGNVNVIFISCRWKLHQLLSRWSSSTRRRRWTRAPPVSTSPRRLARLRSRLSFQLKVFSNHQLIWFISGAFFYSLFGSINCSVLVIAWRPFEPNETKSRYRVFLRRDHLPLP